MNTHSVSYCLCGIIIFSFNSDSSYDFCENLIKHVTKDSLTNCVDKIHLPMGAGKRIQKSES